MDNLEAKRRAEESLARLQRSLPPELQGVLNGNKLKAEIDAIYAHKSAEEQKAAKAMAEAAKIAGHNLESALKASVAEFVAAGYVPQYRYNPKTQTIDVSVASRADGSKGLNADERSFGMSLPVGRGYNGMVAESGHAVAYDASVGAYFTDYATSVMEQTNTILRNINNSKKGRIPTAGARRLSTAAAVARKEAVASFVPTPAVGNRRNEPIEDLLKRVGNPHRAAQIAQQTRYAALVKAAANAKTDFYKRHRALDANKFRNSKALSSQLESMAADYLFVYQNYGENVARQVGAKYGLTTQDMAELKHVFGPALNLKSVWQGVRDEGLQDMVSVARANVGLPLGTYGDYSRHQNQTTNYRRRAQNTAQLRAILGNKQYARLHKRYKGNSEAMMRSAYSGPRANFRVDGVEKEFYEAAEQQMSGVAYLTQEQFNDVYRKAYIKRLMRQKAALYRKNNNLGRKAALPRNVEQQIQREAEAAARSIVIPGLQDDASVMRKSDARMLGTIDDLGKTLSVADLKALKKEAQQELKDEFKNEDSLSAWLSKKLFGNRAFVTGSFGISNMQGKSISLASLFKGLGSRTSSVNITAQAARRFGGQAKILGFLTGERTDARAIDDEIFDEIVKELNLQAGGLRITNIRQAKSMGSNAIPGLVRGLLSRLARNPKKASPVIGNSALKDYITVGKDGIMTFNQDKFDEDVQTSKAQNILGNILETLASQHIFIEKQGNQFVPADGQALVIADILNMADVAKWRRPVSAGIKERRSLNNMLAASGVGRNTKLHQALNAIYDPTRGLNAERYHTASQAKSAIDKALKATYTSGGMSQQQVDQLIASSFGGGRKNGTMISIGNGSQYSIDLRQFEDARAKYVDGKIPESEMNNLIWGAIEKVRGQILKANPNLTLESIPIFLDPATAFGVVSEYDEGGKTTIGGRLMYLPNLPLSAQDRHGESVYDLPFYASAFNAIANSIGNADATSVAIQDFTSDLYHDVYYKEGSIYQSLNKTRIANSHSFEKPAAMGNSFDITNPEDVKRLTGAFVTAGRLRQMLGDEGAFGGDQNAYMKALAGVAGLKSAGKHTKEELIEKAIERARTQGLYGIANRFPSVDNQSLQAARLYVDDALTDDNMLLLGPALQYMLKADFDGDIVNAMVAMLSKGDMAGMENMTSYARDVMLDVWRMHSGKKAADPNFAIDEKAAALADNTFYTNLSAMATRMNKPYTGTFSMMSTRIRNALASLGMSEGSLTASSTEADKLQVAKGILVSASLQALEQDAIDSKKVGKRIQQYMEKNNVSEDAAKEAIATQILTEFEGVHQDLTSGKLSYSDYIKKLSDKTGIGVFENGYLNSLAGEMAIARVNRLGVADVWSKLGFSPEAAAAASRGMLSGEALASVGETVDQRLKGANNGTGMFSASYGLPIAMLSRYSEGSSTSVHNMIKRLQSMGVPVGQLQGQSYDMEGHIVEASASVATTLEGLAKVLENFIQTFESIGRGMDMQARRFGFLEDNEHLGVTSYLKNLFPSGKIFADSQGVIDRFAGLSDEQKKRFASAKTDAQRAKILGMPLDSYNEAKQAWLYTNEGSLGHGLLDANGAVAAELAFSKGATAFGFSEAQQRQMIGRTRERAAVLEQMRSVGNTPLATELNVHSNKFGDTFTNQYGQYLQGIFDYVGLDNKNGGVVLSDAKFHRGGIPAAKDVAQLVIYRNMLQEMGNVLNGDANKGKNASQLALEYFGNGNDDTIKLVEALRSGKIRQSLHVMDEHGVGREYSINTHSLSPEMFKKLYSETPLTKDEQNVLLGLLTHMTGNDIASGLESAFPASSHHGSGGKKQAAKDTQTALAAENAYIAALKAELGVRKQLEDVQRKQRITTNRTELAALREQEGRLQGQLELQEKRTKRLLRAAGGKRGLSADAKERAALAYASYDSGVAGIGTRGHGAKSIFDVLGNGIQRAFQNFFNFGIVLRAVRSVSTAFEKVLSLTKELDVAMMNLRVVSGQNADQAYDTMMAYNGLAKELGTTTKAVAESANTWLNLI